MYVYILVFYQYKIVTISINNKSGYELFKMIIEF